MSKLLASLFCGTLFGLGLAVAQMTNPEKVLAFLDLAGNWDPSLGLVMGGAVGVTLLTFRWILRRPKPVFAARFDVPSNTQIDAALIGGAVIFGIGWGVAGYCPGPAFAALITGSWEPPVFLVSLLVGNLLAQKVRPPAPQPAPEVGTGSQAA